MLRLWPALVALVFLSTVAGGSAGAPAAGDEAAADTPQGGVPVVRQASISISAVGFACTEADAIACFDESRHPELHGGDRPYWVANAAAHRDDPPADSATANVPPVGFSALLVGLVIVLLARRSHGL